jgi:vitamin B12 transporter
MCFFERRRGRAALSLFASLPLLLAVNAAHADELEEIVVTAYRGPTDISKSGSAITVIDGDQLDHAGAATLVDLFRKVPGVTVTQTGGPGGTTEVGIRGADAGQTVVMIDGVRVNDPATTRGIFDFSVFSPTDIERIEILRGPQSALYGSDAMGGVINIITKKRTGKMTARLSAEGGNYGTAATNGAVGGSVGPVSLSVSGTAFTTDGFSRVGNRDYGEADGTQKLAGTARASYNSGEGQGVDFGVTAYHQDSEVDSGSKAANDLPGYDRKRDVVSGFGRFNFDGFDGRLNNQFNFFAADTSSAYVEPKRRTNSDGTNFGAEYQGTLDLQAAGTLIWGARAEQEAAVQHTLKTASDVTNFDEDRTLLALFAMQQFTLFDRLNLSVGGRYDEEVDGEGFLTGRATAAYNFDTGTKLRGSFGNAAKRPTMFQLYEATYGNPDLADEESYGGDIGIDQDLWDGRLTFSASGFWNRYTNLIQFADSSYYNISSAEMSGLELSADAVLIPSILKATGSYTYLKAINLETDRQLARRPENSGSIGLTFTGIEDFEIGVSATFVGDRFNSDSTSIVMASYTKLDLNASYRLNPNTSLYARVENLTDVTYQDADGYNNAGLSAYAGLTWKH